MVSWIRVSIKVENKLTKLERKRRDTVGMRKGLCLIVSTEIKTELN